MTGPSTPRWTHVALPVGDIDASVAWYTRFTPLVVLETRDDAEGRAAWLCHEGPADHPFILVLVMPYATEGVPHPVLAPFAHLGIELPTRDQVDAAARLAAAAGWLHWEPADLPPPVGYVCALRDPDGNIVELSHGQGVYDSFRERFGSPT